MAPKQATKKVAKEKEKHVVIEKPISKSKKKTKKNYNFHIYIYKVLKQIAKNMGISRKSMLILNNFVFDMLEKISKEAGALVLLSKKNTLGGKDVQTAIKLLVPGELGKHANIEGVKAMSNYYKSVEKGN